MDSSEDDCPTEVDNGYPCDLCGKIYKSVSTLHTHVMMMHPESDAGRQCMVCDKTYPSVLSLQNHTRYMHRYKHRCRACYKSFATPELLCDHGHNCGKSDTPCPQCDKIYDSWFALRNHLKYKHPEARNHWCEVCRRTFSNDQKLINHKLTVHPAGATDCGRCGKSFGSMMALQSHMLYKHTEGRAQCPLCHKAFAKETSLQKHIEKQHNSSLFNYGNTNHFEDNNYENN